MHWRFLVLFVAAGLVGLMLQQQSGANSADAFAMNAAPSIDVAAMQAQARNLPVTLVADYI